MENAVRHGAGTVTVEVAPDRTDGGEPAAAVTVTDQGAGVRADVRQRIFSPFWRGGYADGSGLGLYIVRGIVEAHGGSVDVDSAPGGGARFRVLLPAGHPPYEAG